MWPPPIFSKLKSAHCPNQLLKLLANLQLTQSDNGDCLLLSKSAELGWKCLAGFKSMQCFLSLKCLRRVQCVFQRMLQHNTFPSKVWSCPLSHCYATDIKEGDESKNLYQAHIVKTFVVTQIRY